MEGIIIKNVSNDYVVLSGDREYNCRARGKFRKLEISPLVGDRVVFDEKDNYILEIKKRRNCLIRPAVSNVDQAIIVTSVKQPDFDSNLLDKLLTIISYNNIEPVICFTKVDLLSEVEKKEFLRNYNYYKEIGYTVFINDEIDAIRGIFSDKLSVFTGQSGAGKSSLLNRLDENLELKTDEISVALGRGKHTTRHTELFLLGGGYVVDTPGFSAVDFRRMDKIEIRDNMIEIFEMGHNCKYRDCMHILEDGCYVKQKVDEGVILKTRYKNYLNFIEGKNKEGN